MNTTASPPQVQDDTYAACARELMRRLERYNPDTPADFERFVAQVMREELGTESELVKRLRRVETKVHKIATHVGAEPGPTMTRGGGKRTGDGRVMVHGATWDTTLSAIKHAAEQAPHYAPSETVLVTDAEEHLLATMFLTNR